MSKFKTYLIDCGNASKGIVGFTARVQSTSPRAALKKIKLLGFVDYEMEIGGIEFQLGICTADIKLENIRSDE